MGVSAIVQTQNLSKTYGAINCVNKVDLHVQEGNLRISGSKRSRENNYAKMLLGLIKPSEGTIKVFGKAWIKIVHLFCNVLGH